MEAIRNRGPIIPFSYLHISGGSLFMQTALKLRG